MSLITHTYCPVELWCQVRCSDICTDKLRPLVERPRVFPGEQPRACVYSYKKYTVVVLGVSVSNCRCKTFVTVANLSALAYTWYTSSGRQLLLCCWWWWSWCCFVVVVASSPKFYKRSRRVTWRQAPVNTMIVSQLEMGPSPNERHTETAAQEQKHTDQ